MACTDSPSYQGGWGRRTIWSEQTQCYGLNFCVPTKFLCWNPNPGWVWRLTSVIPALWEAKVDRSPEVRSSRPAWPTWWNPIFTKNTKISQVWWCMPVIPATWEAEAGEFLEPGRWRLQWAKIVSLHSSLGNRVRLCLKKKEKKERTKENKLYNSIIQRQLMQFMGTILTNKVKLCHY